MTKASEIISEAYEESRKNLLESEAKSICQEYNIPVTRFKLAKSEDEAIKSAEEIGYPIVLKIVSSEFVALISAIWLQDLDLSVSRIALIFVHV